MDQPTSQQSHLHPPQARTYEDPILQANQLGNAARVILGVLHEINNDLGPLVGYMSIIESGVRAEPRMIAAMQQSIERVQSHLQRIAAPLKEELAGPSQRICLEELVKETMQYLQDAGFFRRVGTEFVLHESYERHGPGHFIGCGGRMRHALTNILSNAVDAVDKYGWGSSSRRKIRIEARAHATQLQLEIRDFGDGIPDHQIERVFEAFYSTKSERLYDMGLGLGVARDIIQSVQGELQLRSQPDEGTCVLITLPRAGAV